MRGCTFIFKRLKKFLFPFAFLFISMIALNMLPKPAFAQVEYEAETSKKPAGLNEEPSSGAPISGPFSEYGEFDTAEDEANDERFFQYGRFFGIGVGAGLTTATGNAGKLYQGGFPTIDFRLDYWFDFQFALQVSVQNSRHNYNLQPDGLVDTNLFRILFQVKYYLDTRDLSAPIAFVSPHLIGGGGTYRRTDTKTPVNTETGITGQTTTDTVNAFGVNFGAGLELTIKPRKTYLQLEALAHLVQFSDEFDSRYAPIVQDKTGTWITATMSIMWTW